MSQDIQDEIDDKVEVKVSSDLTDQVNKEYSKKIDLKDVTSCISDINSKKDIGCTETYSESNDLTSETKSSTKEINKLNAVNNKNKIIPSDNKNLISKGNESSLMNRSKIHEQNLENQDPNDNDCVFKMLEEFSNKVEKENLNIGDQIKDFLEFDTKESNMINNQLENGVRKKRDKKLDFKQDEISNSIVDAKGKMMEMALKRTEAWIKLHQKLHATEYAKHLISATISKCNSRNRNIEIGSSPLINYYLFQKFGGYILSKVDERDTKLLKEFCKKTNKIICNYLMKKAEILTRENNLDLENLILEVKTKFSQPKLLQLYEKEHLCLNTDNSTLKNIKIRKGSTINFTNISCLKIAEDTYNSFFVPNVGEYKIKFSKEYSELMELALFYGQFIDLASQIIIEIPPIQVFNNKNIKAFNFKHFLELKNEATSKFCKSLNSNIKIFEKDFINKLEINADYLLETLELKHDEGIENEGFCIANTLHVKQFPWGNENEIKRLLTNHFETETPLKNCPMAEIIDFLKAKLTNAQCMIAELMFGSSCDLLKAKVSNTKDKVQLINSLIERNKSICDIVKNMRPKYEEKESEDEKLWRFLSVNIIDYGIIIEASNSKSIGAIIQAQENEISNNGFDSIYNLSSTFSCIKVIRHLLKYSSTSKFLIQNQLSDLLGIKITKESDIKNYLYPTNKEVSLGMIENKIIIYKKLRRKLDDLISKLEPVLRWRFIGESTILNHEINKNTVYRDSIIGLCAGRMSFDELEGFRVLITYSYILSLFREPRFYPDYCLRSKLFCSCNHVRNHSSLDKEICLCIYGIDEETITQYVKGTLNRDGVIFLHFKKYFDTFDEGRSCQIKREYCEEFERKTQSSSSLIEGIQQLSKVWKTNLNL